MARTGADSGVRSGRPPGHQLIPLEQAGLLAGAIVLPNVPRDQQIRLLDLALRAAVALSNPPDLVNTILEVDQNGSVRVYDLPAVAG
jgi:hypothetical protein